jgi:hypothetical protein
MTTTYLSHTVLAQLAAAQAVIDEHLASCVLCSSNESCDERLSAELVFARYRRLPRRKPGLAGAGAMQQRGFGWFGRATPTARVCVRSRGGGRGMGTG